MKPSQKWITFISSQLALKVTPSLLFIFGLAFGVIVTVLSFKPQIVLSSLVFSSPTLALAPTPQNLPTPIEKITPEKTPQKNQQVVDSPKTALLDPDGRISSDFKAPKAFNKRISFWFDVYTKWGKDTHVIHHASYPWVIFEIVSTKEIDNSNVHKWTKYHRAKNHVKNRRAQVHLSLKRLLNRSHYKNLKGIDKTIYSQLSSLRGPRKKVIRSAIRNLRSQLGQKDFILAGIANSRKYLPMMEDIFKQEGLPTELTRLPFVESSFNEDAKSKVGASGIWQIMPRVGKTALIVDSFIDERNSPLKATHMAAKIFKQNKRILKTWPLAISAYNHGAFGLKKALKTTGSKNLVQLVSRHTSKSFRFASKNFYASFMAILHAQKYAPEIYDIEPINYDQAPEFGVVSLKKPIRPKTFANGSKLDDSELLSLNKDIEAAFNANKLLPKGFRLIVPKRAVRYLVNKNNVLESSLRL